LGHDSHVIERGNGKVVTVFAANEDGGEEEGEDGEGGAGEGSDAEFGGDGGMGVEGAEVVGVGLFHGSMCLVVV
jgi:hypothetical protein